MFLNRGFISRLNLTVHYSWNYLKDDQSYGATVSLTDTLSLVYKYGSFVCTMTESNQMIMKFGLRLDYCVAPNRDTSSRSVSE